MVSITLLSALGLRRDEEADKRVHAHSRSAASDLCLFVTMEKQRRLLTPVSAECGLIREKITPGRNSCH